MDSINTNYGATIALQALNAASGNLEKIETEISTGLKVNSPTDNGATWAVAQSERSQISSWQTVSDSLSRGQSLVDIAESGATHVSDVLAQIKSKWLALSDPGATPTDTSALVSDIKSLVSQINTTVNTSTFDDAYPLCPAVTTVVSTPTGATTTFTDNAPQTTQAIAGVSGTQIVGPQTFSVDGGPTAGPAVLSLSLGIDPDVVEIYQNGQRVAATGVPPASGGAAVAAGSAVSGDQTLQFDYDPANGRNLQIEVDNGLRCRATGRSTVWTLASRIQITETPTLSPFIPRPRRPHRRSTTSFRRRMAPLLE